MPKKRSSKYIIRLNVDKLAELQSQHKYNDSKLARKMGIGYSTLWRARLPVDDPRYNAPGEGFIAGALGAFPGVKFEELFFLDSALRQRNMQKGGC